MRALRFTSLVLGLSALPAVVAVRAAEVRPGNTLGEVRASLGIPRGEANLGDRQLLYYDRGEVELRAGSVTRVALLSDREFAAREARRAAESERVRARNAEGEALKARRLADADFRSAPPEYQLAYWENFIRRYPGVSCADQLALIRARLAEKIEEGNLRQAETAARIAPAVMTYDYGYSYYFHRRYYTGGLGPFSYHFEEKPISRIAGPVVPPVFNFGTRDVNTRRDARSPNRDSWGGDGLPPSCDDRGSHGRGHATGRWGCGPQGRM
jgi:hypothetical protein